MHRTCATGHPRRSRDLTSGRERSSIPVLTKDTIAGTDVLDYVDEEYALKNYVRNNSYNFEEYPNAIDPTVFYDADDRMWMVYGSWSGGIFLLELDPATPDR